MWTLASISVGQIGLHHYLFLAAVLFVCGVLTMMLKRNAIGILMGVELVLNAANVNLVAFNRFAHGGADGLALSGQVFAVFIIVLAAAEAAVALAIVLAIFINNKTIDVTQADTLKE